MLLFFQLTTQLIENNSVLTSSPDYFSTLIPAISALIGALIGGSITIVVTFLTFRHQKQEQIMNEKIKAFNEVNKHLIIPIIDKLYFLLISNDESQLEDLIFRIRGNREYFLYCRPKILREKLIQLYLLLEEKKRMNDGGVWKNDDLPEIIQKLKEIEDIANKILDSMEL